MRNYFIFKKFLQKYYLFHIHEKIRVPKLCTVITVDLFPKVYKQLILCALVDLPIESGKKHFYIDACHVKDFFAKSFRRGHLVCTMVISNATTHFILL